MQIIIDFYGQPAEEFKKFETDAAGQLYAVGRSGRRYYLSCGYHVQEIWYDFNTGSSLRKMNPARPSGGEK